ncbi:hypothetical protein [Nocardia camponoti]|nr:hypothetical protein [Nocardia camponoti]
MGDVVLVIEGRDFSTRFGWMTLIHWCVGLCHAVQRLEHQDQHELLSPESDDVLRFIRVRDRLTVSASYVGQVAVTGFPEFSAAVNRFVAVKFGWIEQNYSRALLNPGMRGVYRRIGRTLPRGACGEG